MALPGPLAWLLFYTNILCMLTKRLTKIGDSTGLVIDKPILDLLGLARGDEVELKIEDERLIVGRVDASTHAERHRAKFAKAKARVHANVGAALAKLAK
jgi:antitoxin component of MazEF toxin-antitoxin module